MRSGGLALRCVDGRRRLALFHREAVRGCPKAPLASATRRIGKMSLPETARARLDVASLGVKKSSKRGAEFDTEQALMVLFAATDALSA